MNNVIVEASHINFGGGYTLLIELLKNLSDKAIPSTVYISRKSVFIALHKEQYKYVTLIKTTTLSTILRYACKRSNIIFFANLPPFVKNNKSVVYFHNELILNEKTKHRKNLKLCIYYYWIKFFINNVNTVACQTNNIGNGLEKTGAKNILKLPFFEVHIPGNSTKIKHTFCYVCSGAPHKNVERLLNAFKQIIRKYDVSIAITIEKSKINRDILQQVESINRRAGKEVVINYGMVSKEKVMDIYKSSKALVFPSLKESLGLPLIEANICGIKVLSSDLPYSHEVLNSPIVFNPYESNEIAKTLDSFINGKYEDVVQTAKIKNKIEELINLVI